ncbi:MAG: hypothetical protein JWM68_4731 [Verrucomicrobiales bacterium]|nr:hypothetical protein [Verrucomicrobiales bacterium]
MLWKQRNTNQKHPTSKTQTPKKFQTPNTKNNLFGVWALVFGVSPSSPPHSVLTRKNSLLAPTAMLRVIVPSTPVILVCGERFVQAIGLRLGVDWIV